jgi:hypothetical protein
LDSVFGPRFWELPNLSLGFAFGNTTYFQKKSFKRLLRSRFSNEETVPIQPEEVYGIEFWNESTERMKE